MAFVLFLYPVSVVALRPLNGPLLIITILTALWFMTTRWQTKTPTGSQEKLIYLSMCLFFLSAFFCSYLGGINDESYKKLEILSHLLLLYPLTVGLRHVGINLRALWLGLVLGAIITTLLICYLIFINGVPRAGNIINAIGLGNLILIIGTMPLAGLGWFRKKHRWLTLIPICAFCFGLLGSFLSLTRGGWLAIPVLLTIFLWYGSFQLSAKIKSIIIAFFAITLITSYLIPQTGVSKRLQKTTSSLSNYLSKDDSTLSSAVPRLEIWQAAWKTYTDHPVTGTGWGHFKENAQAQVDAGTRHPIAANFTGTHNMYLSTMSNGGTLTLVTFLFFFTSLILFFSRTIKTASDPETQQVALAGLLLVVGYMVFNLTASFLEASRNMNFFTFYLAIFLAAIPPKKAAIENA